MNRMIAAAAAVAIALIAAPAGAVTISPNADGTHLDARDAVQSGDQGDDARVNTVDISDASGWVTGCLLEPTECDLSALTVGRAYNAVVVDSGPGVWDCSVTQDIDCSWVYPSRTTREYVFTYTGQPNQKLTRYFAPAQVKVSRAKAHRSHRWAITCSATRAGEPTRATVRIQWRTAKRPSWHALRTVKTGSNGRARTVVPWTRTRGAVRCVSNADSRTLAAASRAVHLHRR